MPTPGRKYPPKTAKPARDLAKSGRSAPSWPPVTYDSKPKRGRK